MKIVGVSMVKDEVDIISSSLEHVLAEGVDEIVVADNMSTDGTNEVLVELAGRAPVTVLIDEQVGYYQDQKMTFLANYAAVEHNADWIVPFDADEFWCGRDGTLRDAILETNAGILEAETYVHPPVGDSHLRASAPKQEKKVCFRWVESIWLQMGNHDVHHPGSREAGALLIHEFQYRTLEQFKRKVQNGAAAYAATDLDESLGLHWRRFGAMSDDELEAEWRRMTADDDVVWDPWEPSS